MTKLVQDLKVKIIKKEGVEAELVRLSTIAKVLGFANSTPVMLKAIEVNIQPVKIGKHYKIRKSDIERLLTSLLCESN